MFFEFSFGFGGLYIGAALQGIMSNILLYPTRHKELALLTLDTQAMWEFSSIQLDLHVLGFQELGPL